MISVVCVNRMIASREPGRPRRQCDLTSLKLMNLCSSPKNRHGAGTPSLIRAKKLRYISQGWTTELSILWPHEQPQTHTSHGPGPIVQRICQVENVVILAVHTRVGRVWLTSSCHGRRLGKGTCWRCGDGIKGWHFSKLKSLRNLAGILSVV
jgi:hypothetical protein